LLGARWDEREYQKCTQQKKGTSTIHGNLLANAWISVQRPFYGRCSV
jgi:hypothetical protein